VSSNLTDGAVDTLEEPEASDGDQTSEKSADTTGSDATVESDGGIDANTGGSDADTADLAVTNDPAHYRFSTGLAMVARLMMVLTLGSLTGWLGYRLNQSQQTAQQRANFVKRSGPFIDVVKQAQSKSEGTVSLAAPDETESASYFPAAKPRCLNSYRGVTRMKESPKNSQ
jgi:hypothetical protein